MLTVEQILALSSAGFSAEQITTMASALSDSKPEEPQKQKPAGNPVFMVERTTEPEKPEEPEEPEKPEKPEEKEDATPEWFNKFLTKYNADYEELAKGVQARNVRRAGKEPKEPEKSPYELMAEAYNNIK